MDIKKLVGDIMFKIKHLLWIVVAGAVIAAVAWKKHVQDEFAKQDQAAAEGKIKEEAELKLAEETAKLEAEKKAKEAALEAEKVIKLEEIKKGEAENKKKLEELSKKDKEKFKKEVADKLGVQEKKKGRPKKQ